MMGRPSVRRACRFQVDPGLRAGVITLTVVLLLLLSPGFGGRLPGTGARSGRHAGPGVVFASEPRGWYESNVDYMVLEPLRSGPGTGWVLEIGPRRAEEDGFSREERTLYLDGEMKGWEIYRYSPRGLPVEIRRMEPARDPPAEDVAPEDRTNEDQALADQSPEDQSPEDQTPEDQTPEDEPLFAEAFRVSLRYRHDGTIRSVERCAGDECILVRYAPPGPDGVERVRGRDLLLGIHYGPEGKPVYIRRQQAGDPVEEEWFVYEDGRLRSSRIRIGGEETVRTFDAGRVVREELTREGRTVRTVSMDYDRDGELRRRVTVTRARTEEELFFLRPPPDMLTSDEVIRERYVDGALVEQERVHREPVSGGGSRSITRLQRGEIVFRSWYEDDRLVRREIFSGGQVVHVEYPRDEAGD